MDTGSTVNSHYGREDLLDGILAALEAAGKRLDRLTVEDLAPLEEFHIGGRRALLSLDDLMGERFRQMTDNLLRNLEESRAEVVRGVLVLTA